jgi:hypothetical protein
VGEYQYYEFVALDRALTAKQMARLRAISTRAKISQTRFWNEYQWGDLKADPAKLMQRYFDLHLYFANWGTHRLMLRVPKSRTDLKALKPCFVGRHATRLKSAGDHVILDLTSETEEPEYDERWQDSLATLSQLRTELMRGDLRPAYLAWLLAVQGEDVDESAVEPLVPAGLSALTAAQEAMVEFLRIDLDLLAAAANASSAVSDDRVPFRRWLVGLSTKDKDAWLKRAADQPELPLGDELHRAFRTTTKHERAGARRTVGELQTIANAHSAVRERKGAARAKRDATR